MKKVFVCGLMTLLALEGVVNISTVSATELLSADNPTLSQHNQSEREEQEIQRLVKQGKISAAVASKVKLVGFIEEEEQTEKSLYNGISFFSVENRLGDWIKQDGKWWYKHKDGSYVKDDWEKIDGKWYYFDSSGWMKANEWISYRSNWYYVNSSGVMLQSEWGYVNGKWYYFQSDGMCEKEGLHRISGKVYYFRSSGECVSNTGEAMAEYAQTFIGKVPYVWGGHDLSSGVDCSGFMYAIHRAFDISIGTWTGSQSSQGIRISDLSSAQPGDLIFYTSSEGDHVAMYIGNGRVVHASMPGRYVETMSVTAMQLVQIRRNWQ